MTENKFSKYFIYAIGEIILVVIGILIALGINNWNERRKEQQSELILLQKLQEENNLNIEVLKSDSIYRQMLPKTLGAFNTFLKNTVLETQKDSLKNYLSDIMRSTSYTFTQNNLINYINLHQDNSAGLNRELADLQSTQKDLQIISEKGINIKLDNFYQDIKKDIDFSDLEIYDFESLKTLEFRNDILILLSLEQEITFQFNETLSQMRLVDSLITRKLK